MNDNEFELAIEQACEAFKKLAAEIKKIQEAICDAASVVAEAFKKALEEIKYIIPRDPLPQPQKCICMKDFVIDRRKAINRIKKKKGTVFPVSFLRRFYSYQTKCLQSVTKCCIIKE